MKVIGINTSPRDGSNNKIAIQTALDAAAAKGAETEIFDTCKMNISGCQGDNYCKAHGGKCAIDDDMTKIYAAIEEADAIIFGSPIYFGNITGQGKLVIDRLYAYFMSDEHKELFSNKKVSIIGTNGVAPKEACLPALNDILEAFGMLGFQKGEVIDLPDNNDLKAIEGKDDQLAEAKTLGENLI